MNRDRAAFAPLGLRVTQGERGGLARPAIESFMALRNLGKKHTHRVLRDQYRLCPACGFRKPPQEFLSKPRSKVLDMICALCRAENPGIAQRFFHIDKPKPSPFDEHRTAIIELLRERARRWIAKGKEVGIQLKALSEPVKRFSIHTEA